MEDPIIPESNLKPDSNTSVNIQAKSVLHRKPIMAIVLITLLVFITAVSFQTVMNSNIFKRDLQKSSIPTPINTNVNTPTTAPTDPFSITIDGHKFPERTSLRPILKNQYIYYMKSEDIWKASMVNDDKIIKEIIYEGDGKILNFTISNDRKTLAYSIRKNIYPEMDGASDGDTVILVNLENKSEKEIFSQNLEGNQLNGLMFSPDDTKLYFTNTKIYVYDLIKESVDIYTSSAKPFSILCFYNPSSFSPSGRYLLLNFGCWEGSKQVVFDTQTGKTIGEFNNGYIGGGISTLEFLSDYTLLGYDNRASMLLPSNPASDFDYDKQEWKLGAYSINGSSIKFLGVYKPGYNFQLVIYKDSLSSKDKVYFSVPKSEYSKEHSIFEINRSTYEITPSKLKTDLVLLSTETTGEIVSYNIQYFQKDKGLIIDIDKTQGKRSILEIR